MTTKTETTVKTATTKTAAKVYTVKDLTTKLSIDGKKARALLRSLAAETESPRFRVAGKSYEWNGKDFPVVVRKLSKRLEEAAAQCSADCMDSVKSECECHCQGANHGAHHR